MIKICKTEVCKIIGIMLVGSYLTSISYFMVNVLSLSLSFFGSVGVYGAPWYIAIMLHSSDKVKKE